jgi:nucleotide-binding universal stress UspA family protein
MFDNVLVGVDGRSGGRDAIALARRLASSPGGLVLATVDAGAGAGAGQALHQLAEREHADLLVVGSSRRTGIGRVLLGETTLAALDGAPCAVAVAPRDYAAGAVGPADWQTIGVGHDGSAESDLALAAARELARRHDVTIRVLAVVPLQSLPPGSDAPLDWTDATERAIATQRARLAAIGNVAAEVAYGRPATELERFAAGVQLLVVGSRGHGPLGRLLNGSTSTQLARCSPCPLLVMPRRLTETAPVSSDGPSPDLPGPAAPAS